MDKATTLHKIVNRKPQKWDLVIVCTLRNEWKNCVVLADENDNLLFVNKPENTNLKESDIKFWKRWIVPDETT